METEHGPAHNDPWDQTRPRCLLHADSERFATLVLDHVGDHLRLSNSVSPEDRAAVLVDCLRSTASLHGARDRYPLRPIIGVIQQPGAATIMEMLACGADGVIALTDPPATWRECVLVVLGGGRWLGGPGLEVSLDHKHASYDVARGDRHVGDVTMRTRLFVKDCVGQKFRG